MLCYYYYVFVDANTYILLLLTPFWLKMRASNFPNNNSVPNNVFTYLIFQRTQKMHLQAGPYYIAFCCFAFNNHLCIEGCMSSQNFVDVHIHTNFSKKLSCTHGRALQCEICCLVPIHTWNSESKSYLMAEFQIQSPPGLTITDKDSKGHQREVSSEVELHCVGSLWGPAVRNEPFCTITRSMSQSQSDGGDQHLDF